jgi:alkanesulfonate monooxygenase SsuD/methylene tetrahydromethanopterin reductase-like flavin-dependent oxidoreductase (luciferase family)
MAKHADIAFLSLRGDVRAGVAGLKALAYQEFGRTLQVWSTGGGGLVVCAPTEREARQLAAYYLVDKLNLEAAVDWARQMAGTDHAVSPAALAEQLRENYRGVALNTGLIGTPEQITSYLESLAAAGLDGLVLHWLDYEQGLAQWNREVMPLLEQAGLRLARPSEADAGP